VTKGGTLIDPGRQLHAPMDIAVLSGKILEISAEIPESRALRVISAKGKIVTPGMIDIHQHCYDGVADCVNADHFCLAKGVTTVVDAGSAGYPAIANLRIDFGEEIGTLKPGNDADISIFELREGRFDFEVFRSASKSSSLAPLGTTALEVISSV